MESYFSFSEPFNSGIDFYRADDYVIIDTSIDITSNVSVSFIKTAFAQINISGALDTTLNAVFERQDALSNIDISSDVSITITKLAYAASNITSSAVLSSDLEKIAYASTTLSGDVATSFVSQKIAYSVSAINDSSVALSTNVAKIAYASSSISGLMDVALLAVFERQDGSVSISGDVTMTVGMQKIAFAEIDESTGASASDTTVNITKIAISSSDINGNISVADISIIKQAYAASNVSFESNATFTMGKISYANAALSSSVTLFVLGKIVLLTIRINVLNNLNIFASMIRHAANTNVGQDTSLIRNYLLINNRAITNHNRNLQTSIEPIFIQNKNWDNFSSRYYKSTSRGGRRIFNISWTYVPNSKNATVDGNEGRDYLSSIASDPDFHVLKIANMDAVGTTPDTETSYNVLVKDYSETLVRRDMSSDTYYWDCNLTLEEV